MDKLLKYYKECFDLVDCFHFNSELTRIEYEKRLRDVNGHTIPITHDGIKDNRVKKSFSQKGLVVGFIGNRTPYKGLYTLLKAVNGLDVKLVVWGGGVEKGSSQIQFRGKFKNNQLSAVYNEMDVLVVPSICKETFSLVTLEALSFGVPVIVSDNVGAQDVVKQYNPLFVYHTIDDLKVLLSGLVEDKSKLIEFNQAVIDRKWEYNIIEHAKEIVRKIYEIE